MKKFLLAALAIVSLGIGAASAQSLTHGNFTHGNGNQYNWLAGGGG